MEVKKKKCKGRREARGHGCGQLRYLDGFKRGLCNECFLDWCCSTDEGLQFAQKKAIKTANEIRKEGKARRKSERIEIMSVSKYRSKIMQPVFNEIARLIDQGQPCIATGNFGKMNGGHYYTQGAHPEISLNLHNIHIQSFESNHFQSGDERRYLQGLISVYGGPYAGKVVDLKRVYKDRVISKREMQDTLPRAKRVRKWLRKRNHIWSATDRVRLRSIANQYIGLYG